MKKFIVRIGGVWVLFSVIIGVAIYVSKADLAEKTVYVRGPQKNIKEPPTTISNVEKFSGVDLSVPKRIEEPEINYIKTSVTIKKKGM